jgi:hypothetical protein
MDYLIHIIINAFPIQGNGLSQRLSNQGHPVNSQAGKKGLISPFSDPTSRQPVA